MKALDCHHHGGDKDLKQGSEDGALWRVLPCPVETHVPVLSPVFFRAYVLLSSQKDVYILVTRQKSDTVSGRFTSDLKDGAKNQMRLGSHKNWPYLGFLFCC